VLNLCLTGAAFQRVLPLLQKHYTVSQWDALVEADLI
jgi:hypothetical protein